MRLLKVCCNIILKSLHISDSSRPIKADCDAFSFIITFDPDQIQDPGAMDAVKKIIYHFGKPLSEVSLPKTPVANKTDSKGKADRLFGSDSVINSELGDLLKESEILVLSSPVKIALHKSCDTQMKKELDSRGFPIKLSNTTGICFDYNSISKLPPYEYIVESVIKASVTKSCPIKKHVIHIGNIGTLFSIYYHDGSNQHDNLCEIRKLFTLIEKARSKGIRVDVSQMDIAFNIPSSGDKLFQWSIAGTRNETNRNQIFLPAPQVWPLHDITRSDTDLPDSKNQKGSIKLSHNSQWSSPRNVVLLGEPTAQVNRVFDCPQVIKDELMEIFIPDQNSNQPSNPVECLTTDLRSIQSSKLYSTIFHIFHDVTLPVKRLSSYALPFKSMIFIQRLLNRLQELMKIKFEHMSQHGIYARIEISIRPNGKNETNQLRTHGHFTDFLFHVLLGVNDSLNGKNRIALSNNIGYDTVSLKCNQIIQSILSITSMRAEKRFNEVYTSPHMHNWLRANILLITTLIGITHETKIQLLLDWMKNTDEYTLNFYDPLGICNQLRRGNSLYWKDDAAPTVQINISSLNDQQVSERFRNIILKNIPQMDNIGVTTLMKSNSESCSSLQIYTELSLKNKLLLSECLSSTIIPSLARLLHAPNIESDDVEMVDFNDHPPNNIFTEDEIVEDDFYSRMIYCNDLDVSGSRLSRSMEIQHQFLPSYHCSSPLNNKNNPNPIFRLISNLCELCHHFDIRSPLLFPRFKRFMVSCLRTKQFNSTISDSSHDLEALIINLTNTFQDLNNLRRALSVTVPTNASKVDILRSIANFFSFPIDSSSPKLFDDTFNDSEKETNELLNVAITSCSTIEIRNRYFYRSTDNTHINIPDGNSLIQQLPPPFLPDNRVYDDIFDLLDTHLYRFNIIDTNEEPGVVLKDLLYHFLCRQKWLSNLFLMPDASNNPSFMDCASVDELRQFIGLDNFHRNPDVVLPAISLMRRTNIMFYDFDSSSISFHYFHPDRRKIVTFKNDTLNWIPIKPCKMLAKYQNRYAPASFQNGQPNNIVSHSHIMMNDEPFTPYPNFSRHPYGPATAAKKSIVKCLHSLLTSPNVQFSHLSSLSNRDPTESAILVPCHEHDLLDMKTFIEELHFNDCNTKIMFVDIVNDDLKNIMVDHETIDISIISQYIMNTNNWEHPAFYSILIPFVTLKYKLFICLWIQTNIEGKIEKKSIFYWFDPITQKVMKIQKQQFVFHKEYLNFLYVKCSIKDDNIVNTGYYPMPTPNVFKSDTNERSGYNYPTMLSCKFSHVGSPQLDYLFTYMITNMSMNIIKDANQDNSPDIYPKLIPHAVITEQGVFQQFILIVVYPKYFCNTKRCHKSPTLFIHHKMNHEDIRQISKSLVSEQLLHNVVDKRLQLKFVDTAIYDTEIESSGFFLILHLILAHKSIDINHLTKMLVSLSREKNITQHIKDWSSDIFNHLLKHHDKPLNIPYLEEDLPDWICRISNQCT